LNVGLNSSSLAASTTGLSGVDDNAVLAAIVNRGLRYENGESPRVDDDFEDEPEDREPGDEPFVRYMSQSLTNDLPDKFGSSDEDDDDEEVVGWMGVGGDFESRNRDNDGLEDDDDDVREFGRRGLFNERWEGDFQNDDEFGFRGLGARLSPEEHDVNSSDEEEGERQVKIIEEDLDLEFRLATSSMADITASVETLGFGDEEIGHGDSVVERKEKIRPSAKPVLEDIGLPQPGEIVDVETSLISVTGKVEGLEESHDGTKPPESIPEIRPDDVD